jgi:plasmid stabilization system protein ParE
VKLRTGRRAARQAIQISDWWGANRPAAAGLFNDELRAAFRLLRESPGIGSSCPSERRPDLRRLLIQRTGHHVYYRVDERSATVHVLAIWSVQRGRGPGL